MYPGSGPSSGLKVDRAPNVVTPLTSGWAYSEKRACHSIISQVKSLSFI